MWSDIESSWLSLSDGAQVGIVFGVIATTLGIITIVVMVRSRKPTEQDESESPTGRTPPQEPSPELMNDDEIAELREKVAEERGLFVLNYTGPVRENTAAEPNLSFRVTYNPSVDWLEVREAVIDWQSKEVLFPEHRVVVGPMEAGQSIRITEVELDPRHGEWVAFEMFVEIEFCFAGDFEKNWYQWKGGYLTMVKPHDWDAL